MSIIHFADTQMAAGADSGGQLLYPVGGWQWNAGGGSYYGENVNLLLYGEDTGHGRPGEWAILDFGLEEASGVWLSQDGDGVEDWLFRTNNIIQDSGSIPGQVTDSADWGNFGRTDWRKFGSGPSIVEITLDTTASWNCGSGSYTGSESILGIIEFSKYPRDTTDVFFDAANVNTSLDRITIAGHPFSTGDQAVYIVPDGETGISGTGSQGDTNIVDTEFLSIHVLDGNTIQLGSNLAGVDSESLSLFNLTGAGTGTGHILKKIEVATPSNVGGDNTVDLYANA